MNARKKSDLLKQGTLKLLVTRLLRQGRWTRSSGPPERKGGARRGA